MAQSPSSVTSAPAAIAPAVKAAAIDGDERRVSCPTATRFAPVTAMKAAPMASAPSSSSSPG